MQISRHWRLNAQRYRLTGVRHEDGHVSVYDRPNPTHIEPTEEDVLEQSFEQQYSIEDAVVEQVA